jgi:hypothetical protein
MAGDTHDMELKSKEEVSYFIEMYRKNLKRNQRVKVTCDILGIDGYLQGTLANH